MLKAVIFDMDGVLINSEPYYLQQRIAYFKLLGLNISDERIANMTGGNMKLVLPQLLPGRTPTDYEQMRKGYRYFKLQHPQDFKATLMPDALKTLTHLQQQGVRMALASSSDRQTIDTMLTTTGLGEFFEVTLSGEDFERSKPDPSIYLTALAKLQIDAKDAAAVEDSEMGIAAAKAAGIFTFAVAVADPRVATDQSQADYRLRKLGQLTGAVTLMRGHLE
ncbi:HAD family hydrolase [Lapidilactobacillus bayanensis]|uniref:HAD family hydrolase n=1 Tax=Lapidilactobacillus bayanensis TaxID=2485998 RepID=UPI000F79BBE9|nr:HAD family phosphatase [Lapidilactobacillus bayanensis]